MSENFYSRLFSRLVDFGGTISGYETAIENVRKSADQQIREIKLQSGCILIEKRQKLSRNLISLSEELTATIQANRDIMDCLLVRDRQELQDRTRILAELSEAKAQLDQAKTQASQRSQQEFQDEKRILAELDEAKAQLDQAKMQASQRSQQELQDRNRILAELDEAKTQLDQAKTEATQRSQQELQDMNRILAELD